MKTSGWLGLAAAALLLVGLVFGLSPVTSDGFDCGNAFAESGELKSDEFTDVMAGGDGDSGCDEARSARQPVSYAALGVGVLLGFVGLVLLPPRREPRS